MSEARITWIGGPVLRARMTGSFSVYEAVSVGPRRLLGEVIQLKGEELVAQVYEDTTGLEPGDTVAGTGRALSVQPRTRPARRHLRRPAATADRRRRLPGPGRSRDRHRRTLPLQPAGGPRRRARHGRLARHGVCGPHAADPGAAGRGRPPRVARRRGRVRGRRADRAARRRARRAARSRDAPPVAGAHAAAGARAPARRAAR